MSRFLRAALGLSTFLVLAGCGDSAGSGGGGEGGGGEGGGGEGGGASCTLPDITVAELEAPDGGTLDCEADAVVIDGIARFDAGALLIDVCLPSQDCAPTEYSIRLAGPATFPATFTVPEGTFVRATLRGCAFGSAALVRNLPVLDGLDNPTADHEGLWLFTTSGPELTEFGAATEREGISTEYGVVCTTEDLEPSTVYDLTLSFDETSATVTLPPGEETSVTVPSGPQAGSFVVRQGFSGLRGNMGEGFDVHVFRVPE